MTALFLMVSGAFALADNTVPDGDGLTPIAKNAVAFGTVCEDDAVTQAVLVDISRNGAYDPGTQVFQKGTTATVTVSATSGSGFSVALDASPSEISIPANWDAASNNTLTGDPVSATVTLDTSSAGAVSGTITFRSTGKNPSNSTINRDDTINVTGTVEECTPVDVTAPVISYVLNPATPDGDNGWYKSPVTLTWTVTENESPGSLVKTGCVDQNIIADQLATTYSCSATSDGGSAGPVNVTIKRDATNPTVSLVGGPADGASYYFGSVPAAPTCSASDATSGLAGACSVSGYSAAVGTHTVTASAADNAGNTNSDSATYDVLAWTLNGFYSPVDMNNVINTVKGGSTVPLKFEIFAGTTELTATSSVQSFVQTRIACDTSATIDEIEVTTTGGTSLRYDTTAGQFIQNWQTPKQAGACYRVTMTTLDGSSLVAFFRLK